MNELVGKYTTVHYEVSIAIGLEFYLGVRPSTTTVESTDDSPEWGKLSPRVTVHPPPILPLRYFLESFVKI